MIAHKGMTFVIDKSPALVYSYKGLEMGTEKRLRWTILGLTVALAIMMILSLSALKQRDIALSQQSTAQAASTFAVAQQATAQADVQVAQYQATIARAGELAAQSISTRDNKFHLSLLLGIEAYRTFDTPQSRSALLDNIGTRPQLIHYLMANASKVFSLDISRDGKTLASGNCGKADQSGYCSQSEIILWDLMSGKPIGKPLKGYTGPVESVAFSPDGKTLASGSFDNTIILWDATTGKSIGQPLKGHTDVIYSVAFSPDGKILASGSADTSIILWDVENRQPIGQPLKGHTNEVTNVAFSPDGKTLTSSGWDSTIILWDIATRQPSRKFKIHTQRVSSMAFNPDGKMLVSGSEDGTIILWDVATGKSKGQPLMGDTHLVSSVVFSPDSKTLASGSWLGTIFLWDVATGQPIGQPLKEHTNVGTRNILGFLQEG